MIRRVVDIAATREDHRGTPRTCARTCRVRRSSTSAGSIFFGADNVLFGTRAEGLDIPVGSAAKAQFADRSTSMTSWT